MKRRGDEMMIMDRSPTDDRRMVRWTGETTYRVSNGRRAGRCVHDQIILATPI